MHLVRATPIAVFAEIESPRGAGNSCVQALATRPISTRLHRAVEGIDRSGLVKHDEDVDDGFRAEPGNRRAADVMDP